MPRIETITRTLYAIDELSDKARAHAIEKYREHNLDYDWWELIYEDARAIGARMGITVDGIGFSGFWSQGGGAHFEGAYRYVKGAVKAVRDHTGAGDAELIRIAEELQRIQRPHFYRVTATVKHRGHYQNEYCAATEVDDGSGNGAPRTLEDDIKEALRDFMRWIYRRLETEYEYQQADEQIIESIKANGLEFTIEGGTAR